MKKILILTTFIIASLIGTTQSPKDRISTHSATWYCADDFGMTNDSTTDNTASLQALIDYIGTIRKNSVIYFSKPGVYYFNGPMRDTLGGNYMIKFPSISIIDTQYTITLKGYVRPTFSPSVYYNTPIQSATVLRCGNITGANGAGAFFGGSTALSYTVPGFEDIIIQTVPNPRITAVDFSKYTCTYMRDVVIMAGNTQSALAVTEPTHPASYGYKQPLHSSGINQRVEGVLNIQGFYNGISVGEGAMINDLGVWACKRGIEYLFSYGSSEIGRAIIGWCPIGIRYVAFHKALIRAFNNEHYLLAPAKWFQYVADLVDSTNTGAGHIEWLSVEANVGNVNTFTKHLGTNIYTHHLGTFPFDAVSQWRDTTGGIYYSGNVGVGSVLPTSLLHVKKNQNAPTDAIFENTASGGGVQTRLILQNDGGYTLLGNYSTATAQSLPAFPTNSFGIYSILQNGINIISDVIGGNIKFATGGSTEKMRLFGNGALGIGQTTDSSTAKLLVNGTTLTTGIIGSTSTTQPLTYKTTTGIGATGSDHIFQVGNNGNIEGMRVLNNGNVSVPNEITIGTGNNITWDNTNKYLVNKGYHILDFPITSGLGLIARTNGTLSTQLSFNNQANYGGTINTLSGRQMSIYDFPTNAPYLGVNATGDMYLGSSNTNYSIKMQQAAVSNTPLTIKAILGQTANIFNISTSSGTGDILTIDQNGKVGIGSIAPSDKLEVTGNIALMASGNKIKIATGTNASVGLSVAMTAGATTISTTAVTTSSRIFLTHATVSGTVGVLSVGTITGGTSFVINSSSGTDTSTINWWIVN